MIKFLFILIAANVPVLYADTECEKKTLSQVNYMRCLDQQLEQNKRDLTTWENNHLFILETQVSTTGRQDGLKMFNKSRETFALYTEQDCGWQFIVQLPDNKKASTAYKECQLYHLKQRIDLLKHIATKPE